MNILKCESKAEGNNPSVCDAYRHKRYMNFIFACYFFYLISISSKMSYTAEMVSIIAEFQTTKFQVGIGLTIYYILYAVAQVAVALSIRKINMRRYIVITSVGSAVSFALAIFAGELRHMWIILALNGIFQSSVFGGCMYFIGKYLPDSMAAFSSKFLSTGLAIGTALSYGVSAFFVSVASWKYTFLFFAVMTVVSIVWFLLAEKGVKNLPSSSEKIPSCDENADDKKSATLLLLYMTVATFFISCMYYGISNWIPNLLKEIYGMPASYSILVTVLIPLGMMFGPVLSGNMCEKHDNYFMVGFLFSLCALIMTGIMAIMYGTGIVTALALSVAILFCIRGVLNLLCSYIPLKLKKRYNAGKFSLIINAFTALGAAVIPSVTGKVIDSVSWTAYYVFMSVICIVSLIILFLLSVYFKRMNKKQG